MFRPFFKYTKRNPFLPSFYVKNYEKAVIRLDYVNSNHAGPSGLLIKQHSTL
ncbi:hypothetical protein TcasGA2_TC031985 [Tribolium castaneum]|uniref:Uncharacterized protein n=1 Tax=Tribolium castaneum TaxID=7070 RepID=A0A139WNG6_TRICA|nr:hypothetical protein TcasGA2_TC031985 [Tribolium castaneum]